MGDGPVGVSPDGLGGLRYVSFVGLADGSTRFYVEVDPARRRARPAHASLVEGRLMPLPDFFVIGAPKSGTTALHVALARHPQLFMSRVKEPKHFLTDGPPPTGGGPGDAKTFREYVWRRKDYEALFDHAPEGTLRGESTPFYLHDHEAQKRILDAVPSARMIALLRDPIDRAHSNWTHLWSAGLEPEGDFLQACALEDRRAARGWAPFWRYLELGRYGEQLQRLYEVVPREQVLVLRYRDLRERPVEALDVIFGFLGVETGAVDEIPAENVTTHVTDSRRNRLISGALRVGVPSRPRPALAGLAAGRRLAVAAPPAGAEPAPAAAARPAGGAAAAGGRRRTAARGGDRRPVRRLAGRRARPAAGVAATGGQDRDRLPQHRRPVRRRAVLDGATIVANRRN